MTVGMSNRSFGTPCERTASSGVRGSRWRGRTGRPEDGPRHHRPEDRRHAGHQHHQGSPPDLLRTPRTSQMLGNNRSWRTGVGLHEIGKLPTRRESRFWIASGLLLPVWDRLPAENMRVRRLATDDGVTLIGRALDAEQARAVHTSFRLDGGPAMTGSEPFEVVMERGSALALANGWRLARQRLMATTRSRSRVRRTPTSRRSGAWDAPFRSSPGGRAYSCRPPWRSSASSNAGRSPPDFPQQHHRAAACPDTYCRPGGGRNRRIARRAP